MPGGARGPAAAAAGEEAARLAPCLAPAGDGFMAWGQHEARLLAARYTLRRYPRCKTLCAHFLPSQTTGLPPSPLNTATVPGLLFAQAALCHSVVAGDRSSHRGKDGVAGTSLKRPLHAAWCARGIAVGPSNSLHPELQLVCGLHMEGGRGRSQEKKKRKKKTTIKEDFVLELLVWYQAGLAIPLMSLSGFICTWGHQCTTASCPEEPSSSSALLCCPSAQHPSFPPMVVASSALTSCLPLSKPSRLDAGSVSGSSLRMRG